MYRTPLTEADERVRAAHATAAERTRLLGIRDALAPDLAEAEAETTKLEAKLADEQRDVRRYEGGVWAFLYGVFADRQARLTKEQREALEAEAKLREAMALRDRLREEVASLEARIAGFANADAELAAARSAKHAAVLASGGAIARELDAITGQLGATDAEHTAVDEALAAGDRAKAALDKLVEVLDSAKAWGWADIASDSFLISWAKRNKLDEARAIAGEAQAEISVFRRELGDIGIALATELDALADHHRFLDVWFDNIFSDFSVQNRIGEALNTTKLALDQVVTTIAGLQHRRGELAARRDQLANQVFEIVG